MDQLNSVDDTDPITIPPLLCLVEEKLESGTGINEKIRVSMISISASTGDVVWDQFEGTFRFL